MVRSRVLRRPTRTLRHTRAEKRCDRLKVTHSTKATATEVATHSHEPQNNTAASSGATNSPMTMNTDRQA
jgi:hypothetical protein